MDTKNRENKLSINELVEIGDYLHDTDCTIIFINKDEEIDKNNILCCIRGDAEKVKEMLFQTLLKDDNIANMFMGVSVMVALHRLEKNTKV